MMYYHLLWHATPMATFGLSDFVCMFCVVADHGAMSAASESAMPICCVLHA